MKRAIATVAGVLLIGVAVAGGYLLGGSTAPTAEEADAVRASAYAAAQEAAKREARADAEAKGAREGAQRGRETGEVRGKLAGAADAEDRVTAMLAAAEAEAAAGDTAAVSEPTMPDAPLICDGAVANDLHWAACAAQGGAPIPESAMPQAVCPPGYHFEPPGGVYCRPD